MPCVSCVAENHFECEQPLGLFCCCSEPAATKTLVFSDTNPRGGPIKDAEDMRDPISTGRKRAAQVKPIVAGMLCEWAKLRSAGGGVLPIIGCNGNEATNIHHGPDKDILNNSLSNLHRICATCHNRWHARNDEYYGQRPTPGTPFLPVGRDLIPHNPNDLATLKEIVDNEIQWGTKKVPEKVNDYA